MDSLSDKMSWNRDVDSLSRTEIQRLVMIKVKVPFLKAAIQY